MTHSLRFLICVCLWYGKGFFLPLFPEEEEEEEEQPAIAGL